MTPKSSPLTEQLILMAENPDACSEAEFRTIMSAVLSNFTSEIQRANSVLSRSNSALDYAAARISQLETELAAAQRDAARWRSLAAGATANAARFLQ